MQKFTNLFIALLACFSMFCISCSNNDDNSKPAREIENEYNTQKVVAINCGIPIPNASVIIKANNDKNATVTLKNIVCGFPDFNIDAEVSSQTKSAVYSFVGSKTVDGMLVEIDGSIVEGVIMLDVKTKINSSIVGSWGYGFTVNGGEKTVDFFDIKYTNTSGKVTVRVAEGGPQISCEQFDKTVKTWTEMILGMAINPIDLTFDKDGYVNIKATNLYATNEAEKELKLEKAARYYYNPTTNQLVFDANIAIEGSPVSGVIQVPFSCTIDGDKLSATIDYEFVKQFLPLIPSGNDLTELLNKLDALVPPSFAFFLPTIKSLIEDIVIAIKDPTTTNIEITGKLNRNI